MNIEGFTENQILALVKTWKSLAIGALIAKDSIF
jgi:hypothetical protein